MVLKLNPRVSCLLLHVFYKHDFDVKKDTLIDHEINEKIAHIYFFLFRFFEKQIQFFFL